MSILQNGQSFLENHSFPPILFEAWNTNYYQEHKNALMDFLCGLNYEILRVGEMDYLAQHPSNDRYLALMDMQDGLLTYQMQQR